MSTQAVSLLNNLIHIFNHEWPIVRHQELQYENYDYCKSSNCISIQRMISALIFYSTIYPLNISKHESKFMEYCEEYYPELLDDYIHIIDTHQVDIDQIKDRMKADLCLITHCQTTSSSNRANCASLLRHHTNQEAEGEQNSASEFRSINLTFYIDILDSIHCFWFHKMDLHPSMKVGQHEIEQTDQDGPEQQVVMSQMNMQNHDIRMLLEPGAKPQVENPIQGLLRDKVYNCMMLHDMKDVITILEDEEYDTDSIEQDYDELQLNSNIRLYIVDDNKYKIIRDCILSKRLHGYTFSKGLRYTYFEQECGSSKNVLYVKTKYSSLKEEMLQNEIYAYTTYKFDAVLRKACGYIHSAKVKRMKPNLIGYPISISHVLSIALYTNTGRVWTAFTSTFRKIEWNETDESVIHRNMEFANMSRLIQDTIYFYGSNGPGSYFCGVEFPAVFNEFVHEITMPLLVSKNEMAAQRFTTGGIIVELKNDTARSFPTSWITWTNPVDNMYLFGPLGNTNLHISGVTFIPTSQNYRGFFRSLLRFHDCLTVQNRNQIMNESDYIVIKNLIEYELPTTCEQKYPRYIHETFFKFIQNLTSISLICGVDSDQYLAKLLLHNNVIGKMVFDLFVNIKQITLRGNHIHLLSLLKVIDDYTELFKRNKLIINEQNYLDHLVTSQIIKQYQRRNFKLLSSSTGMLIKYSNQTDHHLQKDAANLTSLICSDIIGYQNELDENVNYECDPSNCLFIQRMVSALVFYSTINPADNKKHGFKFMEYCNEIYPELLDDYIHIMDKHQNDVDQINDRIKTDLNLMPECYKEYQNCALLSRHYRDRMKDPAPGSLEYDVIFYSDLLDSVHCLWLHSFHLGLRVKLEMDEYQTVNGNNDKNSHVHQQWFDSKFRMRQSIIRRSNRDNSRRFKKKMKGV